MTVQLQLQSTLVFYDEPLLSVGKDQFGSKYLILLVNEYDLGLEYLAVPVSGGRLSSIKNGQFDVAAAFRDPESEVFLFARQRNGTDFTIIDFEYIDQQDIRPAWLPETGLFVQIESPADDLASLSQERNKPLVALRLVPPPGSDPNSINANVLTQALGVFQRLISHSYKRAIKVAYDKGLEESRITGRQVSSRPAIDPCAYTLNAIAVQPGSFSITLEPELGADMHGHGEIQHAMLFIDELYRLSADSNDSILFLNEHRGHLAAAYKSFIALVYDTKISVSYDWTMPALSRVKGGHFRYNELGELYTRLNAQENLSETTCEIIGNFRQVDTDSGTWRLRATEDGTEFRGKLAANSPISLDGITVNTQEYHITCIEHVFDEVGSLKQKSELLLTHMNER